MEEDLDDRRGEAERVRTWRNFYLGDDGSRSRSPASSTRSSGETTTSRSAGNIALRVGTYGPHREVEARQPLARTNVPDGTLRTS